MVDVKEIKSVKLAPFTLMTSSINAILSFIAAIVMLIIFGTVAAFIPQAHVFSSVITALGVALIIILPISAFFIQVATSFFSALLYNSLVPRLGGIKLALEGTEVTEIPVISFALILAGIEAIWAFIVGLFLAASLAPFTALLSSSIPGISQAIANASAAGNLTNITNATIPATMPTGAGVTAAGIIGAVFLIIALPIIVFVAGFISNALAAIFYNYLATRVAKIKLEFAAISGTLHELRTIPPLPAALAAGVVAAVFGFINGLVRLGQLSAIGNPVAGVGAFVGDIVWNFILYFVIVALAAIFYNYLAPRIGGIKLDLE